MQAARAEMHRGAHQVPHYIVVNDAAPGIARGCVLKSLSPQPKQKVKVNQ